MKQMMTGLKRILFLIMTAVCIAGFCSTLVIVREGREAYEEAMSTVSLEDRVSEIREKENFTSYDELPEIYVQAVVSVEDKRFFMHSGIDPIAICRAILHDIQAGRYVEGGSTITQQLAKNLYFGGEKQLSRKIAEVMVAMDLEENYTKEEIMELYVNTIYFGDGYYEIASAVEGYFGKLPEEMTKYEATLLAGIPNAPSKYAPTKNPDLAAKRQLQVVRRMEACGYFSADEAETVAETVAAQLAVVQ